MITNTKNHNQVIRQLLQKDKILTGLVLYNETFEKIKNILPEIYKDMESNQVDLEEAQHCLEGVLKDHLVAPPRMAKKKK